MKLKRIRRKIVISLVIVAAAASILWLIREGYDQLWTGFASYVDSEKKTVPPKRLWDWLTLLIVPGVLAILAWVLGSIRSASDARVENDRQRQKALDDYMVWMTDFIRIDGDFDERTRVLLRARTLGVLRVLDGGRKAQLLQFLYEAGMLFAPPKINLNGADFRKTKLTNATLRGAELRGVLFHRATFRNAHLDSCDLRGSIFWDTDFRNAKLTNAKLAQAEFIRADLRNATLPGSENREDTEFLACRFS